MTPDGALRVVLVLLLCLQSGSGLAASSSRKDPHVVAASIMNLLRASTSSTKSVLDLETDFYDASTGLYSEGVWHNALAGITCLALGDTQNALQIADSLYRWNWDKTSFRRRAWSGRWDHSKLSADSDVVQANYYRESNEHRCVQHAMALVFWSELVCQQLNESMVYNNKYRDQQRLIAARFLDQFWNNERWRTISQEQGGGTRLRSSASANKSTDGGDEEPYFRAVDQAVAVLACLAHLKVLKQHEGSSTEANKVQDIIQTACTDLETSFGFGGDGEPTTYLGLERNRNFWHEGWVLLALLEANYSTKLSGRIYQRLVEEYSNDDGTVWHWPTASRESDSNVRYCGDNAMMYAIRRRLQKDDTGFWDFLDMLKKSDQGLASVADAYPQVRLHPNTELAAFLIWPSLQP